MAYIAQFLYMYLFILSKSLSAISSLKALLLAKFTDITINDGLIHSYLGMTWDFSTPKSVSITMSGYIDDLFSFTAVSGSAKTPATNLLFNIIESPSPSSDSAKRFQTLTA
jgi:hypothetical protein